MDRSTEAFGLPTFEDRPAAKVNLTLEVLGRRPDGFHELRSVFLRIGLTDRLSVSLAADSREDSLHLSGLAGSPTRDNLALLAVAALRHRFGIDLPPLAVSLDKRIPIAAGLGGGSSDCATAMRLAQACWGVKLAVDEEMELAARLGSDVPFFASDAAAARVEGRGETVTPIPVPVSETGLLLVTPPVKLSTAAVFARFDTLDELTDDANQLWPAAASLEASLAPLRELLELETRMQWLMSGSGPTLFALYPSVELAAEAGLALVEDRPADLKEAVIQAVDLVRPDPTWRYP